MQRRPNIFDIGPTLYKCYVFCSLGSKPIYRVDDKVRIRHLYQ